LIGVGFILVYSETVLELCKLNSNRVLGSQHYCFRTTQDSWDVAFASALTSKLTNPKGCIQVSVFFGVYINEQYKVVRVDNYLIS